jgi:hypothetical protein
MLHTKPSLAQRMNYFLPLLNLALRMESVHSSETLVYSQKNTQRNNPEDHHL